MAATEISGVIDQLTTIVDRSKRDSSRLGYFAALYRKVTISVKDGISAGRFEDAGRMERLDVRFANRYLGAYDLYQAGKRATQSWQLAFDAARRWRPLTLQHLLLGMNAHINLDLGIAAAETCPGDQLPSLKHDFDEINKVLADLVQPVQDEIGEVSPWISYLEKIDPHADDVIVNFSMDRARSAAWKFAVSLNGLDEPARPAAINQRDQIVAALGRRVQKPGRIVLPIGLLAIRLRESNDVSRVVDVLC